VNVWHALLLAGVLSLVAVFRRRAYLTPWRREFFAVVWDELFPTRVDGRWHRPTACAPGEDGAILVALRRRNTPILIAAWSEETRTLAPLAGLPRTVRRADALLFDDGDLLVADGKRIVRVDLASARAGDEARVVGEIATGRRVGGMCRVAWNGREFVALAELGGTRRTVLVDPGRLARGDHGRPPESASFLDLGHPRGLAWDGARLWEASGNAGRDLVYRIDLARAIAEGSITLGAERTVNGPGHAVRGIVAAGRYLHACDARSRMLCRTRIDAP
jgi:hypothetical protein